MVAHEDILFIGKLPCKNSRFVLWHVCKINIFSHCFKYALIALKEYIGHVFHRVFCFEVNLVGCALYRGVGAVRARIGSHLNHQRLMFAKKETSTTYSTVPHFMSPKWVMIWRCKVALLAYKWLLARVFSGVKLQGGPGACRISTLAA